MGLDFEISPGGDIAFLFNPLLSKYCLKSEMWGLQECHYWKIISVMKEALLILTLKVVFSVSLSVFKLYGSHDVPSDVELCKQIA